MCITKMKNTCLNNDNIMLFIKGIITNLKGVNDS